MSLKNKVISSLSWLILLRYSTRLIDVIKYAFIARLLVPSDLGSFLLATTIVLTFEALTDTGFQFAFIQKQKRVETYAKTLWFLGIGRGFLIAVALCISAPFFVYFFKSPELLPLLIILSVVPVAKGFQSPYVFLFQKNLEFNKEFFYRLFPVLVSSLLSIVLALILKDPLGLVIAIVIGAALESVMSFTITKTKFSYPFSLKKAKELFHYGKHLTAGGIFTLLVTQLDSLFVGRFFGTTTLALYELSFKLANIAFTEVTDIISRVSFPLFSKIQKQTPLLLRALRLNFLAVLVPSFFISLFMFLFAEQILTVAFGESYSSASGILRILSIYGFLRAVAGPAGPLFLAIGKPQITTHISIINFSVLLVIIYPLSTLFGVRGVATAMVLSYLFVLPFIGYHVYNYFKYEKS